MTFCGRPDGLLRLAVRPHATIRWDDVADIFVIERSHKVKALGITVRDATRLDRPGRLSLIMRSPWTGRIVKPILAALALFAEGEQGIGDAAEAVGADTDTHSTFEIATVGWPIKSVPLVDELRSRWIAAGGRPPDLAAKNEESSVVRREGTRAIRREISDLPLGLAPEIERAPT